MKTLTAFIFLMSTLVVQQNVQAETTELQNNPRRGGPMPSRPSPGGGYNRGPNRGGGYNPGRPSTPPPQGNRGGYNPNPGRGNPGPVVNRPAPQTPPRYNPAPNPGRGNPGPVVNRPAPQRPPRYNPAPNPGRGNPGPVVNRPAPIPGRGNPGPVVNRPNPQGPQRPPRYNPRPNRGGGPVVTRPGPNPGPGRVYRPYPRPNRSNYGTRDYHHPYGYSPVRYVRYQHAPYRAPYVHTVRYYRTYDWYNYVYRSHRNYIYVHWIFWPVTGYNNGYWTIDNYPYYVYNGYRYRYSSYDYCNYQLVDSNDHRVVQTYWNQLCNVGYDACSYERDRLNDQMNEFRYFCSETWRDYDFDYSTPSYDDSYYGDDDNTCVDADRDGQCDDYEEDNTCSDNDNDGYCDTGTYSIEYSEESA